MCGVCERIKETKEGNNPLLVKELETGYVAIYECLGNGEGGAHIHWHLFPRRPGDIDNYGNNGKGPVW